MGVDSNGGYERPYSVDEIRQATEHLPHEAQQEILGRLVAQDAETQLRIGRPLTVQPETFRRFGEAHENDGFFAATHLAQTVLRGQLNGGSRKT